MVINGNKAKLSSSFFKSLCFNSLLCKKDRQRKAQARISDVFENSLDIRRLVDDHFKLNLLIDTLLTPNQRFLFHNQCSKAVKLDEGPDDKEKSIWTLDEELSDA